MIVACQAWEGMYQGLHGIESIEVMEVSNDEEIAIKEINAWGNEESEGLISSYGLEEEYLGDEEEAVDITETNCYCDRGWIAYKVRDDIKETTEVLNDKIFYLGFNLFVEEYCEKQPLDI